MPNENQVFIPSQEQVAVAEIMLRQAQVRHQNYQLVLMAFRNLVVGGVVLACVWMIVNALPGLVAGKNPEEIAALATLVESFGLSSMVGYVVAMLTTVGWLYERNGKKRAIKEKSRYQKLVEVEPQRSTSGLTVTGDTPKGG